MMRGFVFLTVVVALCSLGTAQPPIPQINIKHSNPFGDPIGAVSQARFQDQKTEQESLETKKKKQDTYWAMKRRSEQEQATDVANKKATNEKHLESKKSEAPSRLSSRELDKKSGTIRWPVTMDATAYAEPRRKVDALYKEWATNGNRSGLRQDFVKACDSVEAVLQQNLKTMPSEEYLEAKRFLESLRYEQRDF